MNSIEQKIKELILQGRKLIVLSDTRRVKFHGKRYYAMWFDCSSNGPCEECSIGGRCLSAAFNMRERDKLTDTILNVIRKNPYLLFFIEIPE